MFAPSVRAGPSPDAETLVAHGLELRRQHDDAGALAEFERAYAVEATPRCRAQIGLAEQSLGQWLAAETDLHAALAAADDPWIVGHRAKLEEALDYVASSHLAWLTVDTNIEGAQVTIDGASVGPAPLAQPARVVAGSLLVRVSAPGYSAVERTVAVGAGAKAHASIDLAAPPDLRIAPPVATASAAEPNAATYSPTPHKSQPPGRTRLFWAGVGSTSAGIVGLGFAGAYGIEALVDKAERDQHCNGDRCDAQGGAYDSAARNAAAISTIFTVAGAATTLGGVVLLWMSRNGQSQVAVIPRAGPKSCSLDVVGVW